MLSLLSFRVIFLAALVALLLGPPAVWLAQRFGLWDIPLHEPHKQHKNSVPIAGGMILLATILIISVWQGVLETQTGRALLFSASITFLFGLWDDFRPLSPLIKLTGQVITALVLVRLGIQIRIFAQDWINISLTVLWIAAITNAYNFVDSMDGLAMGLAGLSAAFFMLVSFDAGQIQLSILNAILLGASIGCFYFNNAPARFFLGDSGSQLLGFLLAAIAIAYNPPGFEQSASWYVPILLMGVPIFDLTLVVWSRLRRGRPIYKASRDHTYHRLIALGMSANRAVLTMHMTAMLLGCLAFIALSLSPLLANFVFFLTVASGAALLVFLESRQTLKSV